jgi:alcohol dehydrogenase
MIQAGKLAPEKLIGKTISLDESLDALINMNSFSNVGVTVIDKF